MVPLPDFLQPFQTEAERYLAQGLVRDIEFSGYTYQVQVKDPKSKKEIWTFLQLDQRGGIKDCFCSCEEGEELNHCAHLAASYMRIYNNHPTPLHQRFYSSLWHQLCKVYQERMGDNPKILHIDSPGHYFLATTSGRVVFFIKGKTKEAKEHLKELIDHRRAETEDSSLKFSNLSQEELNSWREGHPSASLRYELSFWNDFAHWLMQLQEEGTSYKITFGYSPKELPNYITIDFSELEVGFYLSEAQLPNIIPTLETVKSPLTVHKISYDNITKIIYDKKLGIFQIKNQTHQDTPKSVSGIEIDGWTFVPKIGFYERDSHQTLAESITTEKIETFLNEHTYLIQRLLENDTLHNEPIQLSYSLQFDSLWNLHIKAYAFEIGDLSSPYSRKYGNWIYLENSGFYLVDPSNFSEIETIISANDISDFVSKERSWLNSQEGFITHLSNVEALLSYTLDADKRLRFTRTSLLKSKNDTKDFGSWVYMADKGFYAKVTTATNLPVRPDIAIGPDQIPLFIRNNRSELQLVPGFFSDKSPISKIELHVTLTEEEGILLFPKFESHDEYKDREVLLFDEFSYVPEEGFCEIPIDARLPERFRHQLYIEPDSVPSFLSKELDTLLYYSANIDKRLLPPKTIQLAASNIEKEVDRGLYVLKLHYQTERGSVPLSLVWGAIKKKKRYLFSEAGSLDLEDNRFEWIRLLHGKNLDRRGNVLHLSTLELIRLNALDPITIPGNDINSKNSKKVLQELTDFHVPEQPNLTGLKSELRPYQQLGTHWLWFLYKHGLSGLLCDEMGLGKTHQAMALLAAIINEGKKTGRPQQHFLIVCPTSVIYHWQEKIQSFLPGIRVCIFHGGDRSLEAFSQQYDILLTSYGIWRIEHELLSKVPFELAVLDEIQIAKNHSSKLHITLRKINSRMRLGLTGTPIENHLRELKSLFDLVLPTYMPSETEYREFFIKPIEREDSKERRNLLSRFIKPFIIRRKKKDVLFDLPEKIEEISHCDLSEEQLILYNQALLQSRQRLMDQLQDETSSVPYIHIFALLSSLKQICNHPAVFFKDPYDYKKYSSGKWDLFLELFNEARESQQKVVIFSQYLNMLDIFENYLNENDIQFATIRGATIKRGEEVRRFNQDPKCEVFLGSLQAAGLGVDLTAGSVLIHYDRWWNAARENQATDRVHRIGQTRGVQVFKLVTKGTFEERIDEMITRKGRLMEDVVSADDHRFMKLFDRNELMQLLQTVHIKEE